MGVVKAFTSLFRPDNDSTRATGTALVPVDDPEAHRRSIESMSLDELATVVRQATNVKVAAEAEEDRARRMADACRKSEAEAKAIFRSECVRRNLA